MLTEKTFSMDNQIDPKLIIQDSDFRFVSDYEKGIWNYKADNILCTISNHGLMSIDDKIKLNSIDINANNYIHPNTHPATIINETENRLFMTNNEKIKLQLLENYTHPEYHEAHIILENSNKRFVSDKEKEYWNNKSNANHKHDFKDILCNVDNTRDIDKPISKLTQLALNKKVNIKDFNKVKNHVDDCLKHEAKHEEELNKIIDKYDSYKTEWGKINGSIQNQRDLCDVLDQKVDLQIFELQAKSLKELLNNNRKSLNIDKINNTSDLDKPISNLCKIELNKKVDLLTFNKHMKDDMHITMEERMRWNNMCTCKFNEPFNEPINRTAKQSIEQTIDNSLIKIENYNGFLKPMYDNGIIGLYSMQDNQQNNNIHVSNSDLSEDTNKLKGIDGKEIIETINDLVKEVLGLKSIMCDFVKSKNPNCDINEYSSILNIKEELNRL